MSSCLLDTADGMFSGVYWWFRRRRSDQVYKVEIYAIQ